MDGREGAGTGWAVVVPFLAANVLFGAGLFAHAFLYNFYLEGLGYGEAFMGLAAASMTTGGLAALGPAGLALDRWGPRRAYAVAAVLAFAGLAWGAFAEPGAAILASGVLGGAGTATWRVTMGPVLMAIAPPGIRTRAFSWNVAALLASGSVWTAAAGAVPAWWSETTGASALAGIRVGLFLCALGTLLSAPLVGVLLRPSDGATTDSAAGSAHGAPAADAPGSAPRVTGLARLAVTPRIRWLCALVLVWMLGAALTLPFFNLYFQRVHGMSVERIGLIFGAVQGATALVLVVGGELAQRAGRLRALAGWVVAFPAAMAALAVSGGAALATGLYVLQGLAPPSTNPLLDELLLDEAGPEDRGAVSSWRNGATELSGLLGAGTGGVLLQAGSFALLFPVAALVSAVGGGLLVRSLRAGRPGA